MTQSFQKVKRVQPLVRFKKAKFEEEAAVLTAIREERLQLVRSLKDNQKRYMEGVEELNNRRMAKDRTALATFEAALDRTKNEWHRLAKKVQEVEAQEKAQVEATLVAERELRALERLQERYQETFRKELSTAEQKMLDERSQRINNQRG